MEDTASCCSMKEVSKLYSCYSVTLGATALDRTPSVSPYLPYLQSFYKDQAKNATLDFSPKPIPQINQNYKTKLCKVFSKDNKCSYGDKCLFAHGINELRVSLETTIMQKKSIKFPIKVDSTAEGIANYDIEHPRKEPHTLCQYKKTIKCINYHNGKFCKYGKNCHFIH